MVALTGISVNAAIVLISAANDRLAQEMDLLHATVFAARRRVVPILITSLTTIAGLFSLAAGIAGRSLVWGPVATAIVWSLAVSTVLTRIVVPLIYRLVMTRSPRVREPRAAEMNTGPAAAPVIDAQVHAYERNHPGRPWHSALPGPPAVTGEDMVRAMNSVGVDGALLVSPWMVYQYDPSYAVEVYQAHPGRFGLITPVDPRREDVAEVVSQWAATPGSVGIRLVLWAQGAADAHHPGIDRACVAAARAGLPVCVLCWEQLAVMDALATRHPQTQFVVDHLGLPQPFEPPPPVVPFAELPAVLALARHPNLAIKVTGVCTLSAEPFPFLDLRAPLERVFDAFGFDRCLWGTDWTRATALLDYPDAVRAFQQGGWLSDTEREALMGGSAARLFGWAPAHAAR